MKRFKFAILSSLFLLFASSIGLAQSAQNSDDLRAKIQEIEKIEFQSKSSAVQQIYKKTLLRLYQQYAGALQQDINDLQKLADAVGNTNTDSQKEIAAQLITVKTERGVTLEKITTLAGDHNDGSTVSGNVASADGLAQDGAVNSRSNPRSATDSNPLTRSLTPTSVSPTIATIASSAEATPSPSARICGQIKPASLTAIFAFISSAQPGLLPKTQAFAKTDAVQLSRLSRDDGTEVALDTDCVLKRELKIEDLSKASNRAALTATPPADVQKDQTAKNGSQKDAVIWTLQGLLEDLKESTAARDALRDAGISTDTIRKQILLLNGYIGNAIVRVEGDSKVLTPRTDKDGNFITEVIGGDDKEYTISTEVDNYYTRRTVRVKSNEAVRLDIPIEDRPVSLLTRAIVGYEQAGAAAAKHDQNYFFDLFVSKSFPWKQKIDPDFGERLRTWIDFRFATVPQTGDVTVGDFAAGFATQVKGLKVKDVARVMEFNGGLEYRLTGNSALLPSFDRLTKQKFSLSLIASGGFTTPTNPLDSLSIFKVPAGGVPGFPQTIGNDFLAFVQSDRDKFFRQYYLGLRMQSFFFNLFNMPMQRFPAQFDVAIGQNEFVTGGKLKGPVVRLDGFYPLPYDGLKFVNLFGTAILRPGHSVTGVPLVLEQAPPGTSVTGPNVTLVAVPQPNRDYYRFGFGIDLMSLIQKWASSTPK